MKKKIHKLNVDPGYDFLLIGISSHENDYRLSWAINNSLGFKFIRAENLSIKNMLPEIVQEFSVFSYYDEDNYLIYSLISNKCTQGFLINELKNIDFFLKITGEISSHIAGTLIEKLKKVDIINTSFQIDPVSIKSKQRFIF